MQKRSKTLFNPTSYNNLTEHNLTFLKSTKEGIKAFCGPRQKKPRYGFPPNLRLTLPSLPYLLPLPAGLGATSSHGYILIRARFEGSFIREQARNRTSGLGVKMV